MKYKCSNCGEKYIAYFGTCKECGEFDTLKEIDGSYITENTTDGEILNFMSKENTKGSSKKVILPSKYDYSKSEIQKDKRHSYVSDSLNDIFGGGLTEGSVNYLYAEPGTGKSTFLGQLLSLLKNKELRILYYSGEENVYQVGSRLERLYGKDSPLLEQIDLYFGESLEEVLGLIDRDKPDIVILDSLQKISSRDKDNEVGSLTQMKYVIDKFTFELKRKKVTGFVIGHITKDGSLAGNKTIEHIVDSIYVMSGRNDRTDSIRLLKCLKSRFGGVDSVVAMKMTSSGLQILEPKEAFKAFVEESGDGPGTTFGAVLEGNQLFLVEVQSLLTEMKFSYPKITQNGFNNQRLDILLAVLLKHGKIEVLKNQDIYLNVIGPSSKELFSSLDLSVIVSIMCSLLGSNFKDYIFLGEVGLLGEIRSISQQEDIINKLIGMGYNRKKIITRQNYTNITDLFKNLLLNNTSNNK